MQLKTRRQIFLLLIVLFTAGLWPLLTSRSFGPEFCQFFGFVYDRPLEVVLRAYKHLGSGWYRPTQFHIPFWFGQQIVDWHNVIGWRLLEFATVLLTAYLVFSLVQSLIPERPRAAIISAVYFGFNPTIYVPLFELFAFDFIHIIAVLLCVLFYLNAVRATGARSGLWTAASAGMYALALTSKELTVVTPALLAVISLFRWRDHKSWPEHLRTEALRLLPFIVLMLGYAQFHLRALPKDAFGNSSDYRLGLNLDLLVRNAVKYPLWMARMFAYTPDNMSQALGYMTRIDSIVGAFITTVVLAGSVQAWRSREWHIRRYILLMLAWIVVFLIVPVYSGGYFWHGNLALCGFCGLVGLSFDTCLRAIGRRSAQILALAVLAIIFVALSRRDSAAALEEGIHSAGYRINATVLSKPPVPTSAVHKGALVYVEDQRGLGWWFYGAGSLFNLVYRDPSLQQVLVPKLKDVGPEQAGRWLKAKSAFFFRLDENYEWHDASAEFRPYAAVRAVDAKVPPTIRALAPDSTAEGEGFQIQPDGTSALGIVGSDFQPGAEVFIEGTALKTTFGKSDWISAKVPRIFYGTKRKLKVQVQNPDGGVSEPATFTVR